MSSTIVGSSISTNIDICINNIDFRMAYSLIPRYTLSLLRSWRKETESFCDAFFFRQGMGLPVQLYWQEVGVLTAALIAKYVSRASSLFTGARAFQVRLIYRNSYSVGIVCIIFDIIL